MYNGIGYNMANVYKEHPTWMEAKLNTATEYELNQLILKHELLLDPRNFTVFFFGQSTVLNAQEYKFLRAILTKKGERVKAEKLMKQIKSGCKQELMQTLSYRIKSKIKCKLKEVSASKIPISENEWVLVDQNYEHNRDIDKFGHAYTFQDFNFEQFFKMLISVKDGYYYTDFRPA